jgi:hypothetical protein
MFFKRNNTVETSPSLIVDYIPVEIISEIASHLTNSQDWLALLMTNKLFNAIATHDFLNKPTQQRTAVMVLNLS